MRRMEGRKYKDPEETTNKVIKGVSMYYYGILFEHGIIDRSMW